MGKLKRARCVFCYKDISRHDEKRVTIKVAKGSNGQGVFREAHLACQQTKEGL